MNSLIGRLIFLFISLLLLASCNQGGGKIEANKEQSAQTATISAPTLTETAPQPVAAQKKASTGKTSSSRKTAHPGQKQKGDYNGITQFNAK